MPRPWSAYPPTADLVALSDDPDLTGLGASQQDRLRASAINAIERWTGQVFAPEGTALAPVERIVDGSGSDTLWLRRRLAELVSLEVSGSWITAADVGISEERDRLFVSPANAAGGTWYDRAMADLTFGEGPATFGDGPGRVAVRGVWGWTEAEWQAQTAEPGGGPLDSVVRAIVMDMEDRAPSSSSGNQLAETVEAARELNVRAISQGNVSISLGDPGDAPVVSERVRRELLSLRWSGKSVAVA